MSTIQGVLLVAQDTEVQGKVSDCKRLEVSGFIQGELETEKLVVHKGGRVYGDVIANQAEIYGTVEGHIFVKNLMDIKSTGSVSGDVKYGQLSLQTGALLEATLRNVPPELLGDFDLHVKRGQSVKITTADLSAYDPDDDADALTYTISNPVRGFIAGADNPSHPIERFKQTDIEAGNVLFMHDNSFEKDAFFDVIVSDDDGATSGKPQTVKVYIMD